MPMIQNKYGTGFSMLNRDSSSVSHTVGLGQQK